MEIGKRDGSCKLVEANDCPGVFCTKGGGGATHQTEGGGGLGMSQRHGEGGAGIKEDGFRSSSATGVRAVGRLRMRAVVRGASASAAALDREG